MVDLVQLSSSPRYPFAPSVRSPLFFNASASSQCTAFIPNNFAMAQAYSALLIRVGLSPICSNAQSWRSFSCGHNLPASARSWLEARPDLLALLQANTRYAQLLAAGHVLRERRAFTLAALAPLVDYTERITAKATDADRVSGARNALYLHAARSVAGIHG